MKYLKYFESPKYIYFNNQKLTTLNGLSIPKRVDGNFACYDNLLTTLEFCPEYIGDTFDCENNLLTTLEFCPEYIGGYFNCSNNKLTTLEFCPKTIGKDFECYNNKLTSLEYCPIRINGNFLLSDNQLTSLKGCPKTVNGNFNCSDNKLTSLEFCPEKVDGYFKCNNNNWIEPIPYRLIIKHNINMNEIYDIKQLTKFGSYKYQKEFLINYPEKYKDLEVIGYDDEIKEEFDWLFNAADMGLM